MYYSSVMNTDFLAYLILFLHTFTILFFISQFLTLWRFLCSVSIHLHSNINFSTVFPSRISTYFVVKFVIITVVSFSPLEKNSIKRVY